MGTATETTGLLTTGDALVDGLIRELNLSLRSDIETFRALAKAVMWVALRDLDGETPDMAVARELMHNGALMFERAVKQARAAPSQNRSARRVRCLVQRFNADWI